MFWSLHFEYRGPSGWRSDSITYSALDATDAIAAALRWMQGRTKIPELYREFLYFQISPQAIGPIGPNGEYGTKVGMRLMEWSLDRAGGVDMETYCAWKIEEYGKKGR